jgi:hypothetical protein
MHPLLSIESKLNNTLIPNPTFFSLLSYPKAEGTPRKVATAISQNCYQPELLNGAVQIVEMAELQKT